MFDVLSLLEKLTLTFQSTKSSISTSLEMLGEVRKQLADRKNRYTVELISSHMTSVRRTASDNVEQSVGEDAPRPKRQKTLPAHFSDSVVTLRLPIYHKPSNVNELRALAVDVINSFDRELEGRFTDGNTEAFKVLLPTSEHFLEPSKLNPFLSTFLRYQWYGYLLKDNGSWEDLFNLLTSECSVFRALLKRKFDDLDGDHVLSTMFRYVQNQDSMIVLSAMFRMAIVAEYSTSTVENSFSARNRVHTDRRRRFSPYKQGDLSLLHFESALLQTLTFEDFLEVWKKKSRRLTV